MVGVEFSAVGQNSAGETVKVGNLVREPWNRLCAVNFRFSAIHGITSTMQIIYRYSYEFLIIPTFISGLAVLSYVLHDVANFLQVLDCLITIASGVVALDHKIIAIIRTALGGSRLDVFQVNLVLL